MSPIYVEMNLNSADIDLRTAIPGDGAVVVILARKCLTLLHLCGIKMLIRVGSGGPYNDTIP